MSTQTGRKVVDVCSVDELRADGVRVVSAGGHMIAVFWSDGGAYAVDNRCPHMGFPMYRAR